MKPPETVQTNRATSQLRKRGANAGGKIHMKWISILAPAYCYPKGTQRILDALTPLPDGVELLISDNTPDDCIANITAQYDEPDLHYWRNTPPIGAGENWNSLLDQATGEYVMLLHHDELPLQQDYLHRLRAAIDNTGADVLVQDVLIMDSMLRLKREHMPRWLRDWIIHHAPGYLFRRNVIGPTAALVVRRSLYPRFNPALRWLIDVELYVRLRQITSDWKSVPGLQIASIQDTHQTLTGDLKADLKNVDATERKLLRSAFPEAAHWLDSHSAWPLRLAESIVWKCFRLGRHSLARIFPKRP